MPKDTREGRAEAPVLLAWGMPTVDAAQAPYEDIGVWVSGGVTLLLWTALAVLLTS